MAAQDATLHTEDLAHQTRSLAAGRAPLAVQLLCLILAAFFVVENIQELRWYWPIGSTLPGGSLGLGGFEFAGQGYVRVGVVEPGGPMAKAGVVPGDKLRFDRRYDYTRRKQVGEPVGFTLEHAGRTTHLQVVTATRLVGAEGRAVRLMGLFYGSATGIGALFGAFIIWRSRRQATAMLLGMAVLEYGLIDATPQLWLSGPRLYPWFLLLGVAGLAAIPSLFYAFAVSFYRDCVGPGKPWERLAFWAYVLAMAAVWAIHSASSLMAVDLPLVGDGDGLGLLISSVGFAICLVYLVLGWRRSSAAVQQRYSILLAATTAIILAQASDYLSISPNATISPAHFVTNIVLTAVIAYPLFTYAILRNKVFDLGFAVNRTLVYGVVSAVLLAAFGLIEWLVEHFVPIQGREKNALVDAAIALGVFLVFHRVRDVVEHGVEGLFFRSWQKAEAALRRFVREAAFVRSPETLGRAFASALSRFADDAPAAVYLVDQDGRPRLTAGVLASMPETLDPDDPALVALRAEPKPLDPAGAGSALPAALIAPMVNRNEVFGMVLLGPKPSGLAYRPDETELIGWATRQVGLDLHALKVEQLEADKANLSRTVAVLEHALSLKSAPA